MDLKKRKFSIVILAFLVCFSVEAQVVQKIGNNSMTIDPSAVLELESTTKGFLPPRLTDAQLNAIPSPALGLFVYNTTSSVLQYFNGIRWISLIDAANSALVTGYTCSTASAGTINVGVPVTGVTQTITAMVTKPGTYNITTTAVNGLTFTGSGKYTAVGSQDIILSASGTAVVDGTFNYAVNSTPSCSFSRDATYRLSSGNATADGSQPTTVVPVLSSTGKTWMDRNLGAGKAATATTDYLAYGALYQWGRGNDGHAGIQWASSTAGTPLNGTTTTKADIPGDGFFITGFFDWRINSNNDLWLVNSANNPCPSGYRVPNDAEWNAEKAIFTTQNAAGAFGSALKLPVAGYRVDNSGALNAVGSGGYYWSATASGSFSGYISFDSSSLSVFTRYRSAGYAVRCIQN